MQLEIPDHLKDDQTDEDDLSFNEEQGPSLFQLEGYKGHISQQVEEKVLKTL